MIELERKVNVHNTFLQQGSLQSVSKRPVGYKRTKLLISACLYGVLAILGIYGICFYFTAVHFPRWYDFPNVMTMVLAVILLIAKTAQTLDKRAETGISE